jgi:hypothetical protein
MLKKKKKMQKIWYLKNAVFLDVETCWFNINWRSSETSVHIKPIRRHIPEDVTAVKTSNPTDMLPAYCFALSSTLKITYDISETPVDIHDTTLRYIP